MVATIASLWLDSNALSKNAIRSNPAINAAAIIADLKPLAVDRLDEVKVLSSSYFAKNNVTD